MYGGDEVSAIVMEIGSSSTKCGYAGEDTPKFVLPSAVGVMGGEASSTDKAKKQYFVGSNAMAVRRDGMRVESPMTDGIVTDWDAAEALMEHSYKSCLGADAADHPLLMAEPSFNTASAREKTAELAFEKFGVPAFFLSKNAVLAAFAAGRGTALVLDVGGGTTCAAAVHDGYVLGSSLQKTPLAGDKINELMLKALELRDPPPAIQPLYSLKRSSVGPGEFKTEVVDSPGTHPSYRRYMQLQVRGAAHPAHAARRPRAPPARAHSPGRGTHTLTPARVPTLLPQVMREAKECVGRCAFVPPSAAAPLDGSKWEYELPDRSVVDFGWERFHLPELFYQPALLRSQPYVAPWLKSADPAGALSPGAAELASLVPEGLTRGLPEMVADVIKACDTDTRRELWGGVVVSGGGSLVPGLTERLHARLNELVPQMSMKVKLIAPATPSERRFAVWIGGSILASLGSFNQLWMSKAEYDEQGAAGIQRKCP